MRPSSLGGGRILRRTLSVRLSVRPSRYRSLPSVTSRHLANYNDTHVRAAYRTAISAAQILVIIIEWGKLLQPLKNSRRGQTREEWTADRSTCGRRSAEFSDQRTDSGSESTERRGFKVSGSAFQDCHWPANQE